MRTSRTFLLPPLLRILGAMLIVAVLMALSPVNVAHGAATDVVLVSGSSWTVPSGVTSVKVWVIGAGGGGAGSTASDGTSGGAGGAGETVVSTLTVSGGSITYTLGAGGSGGTDAANGSAGGTTRVTYGATTINAFGGSGGQYNNNVAASGGTGGGGTAGGAGSGTAGDAGGGGGGAIGGGGGAGNGGSGGGTGGQSVDVSGLQAAVVSQGYSWTSPGFGPGPGSSNVNAMNGSNATGFGTGGGGAGYYGGSGGSGYLGGGGGGAAGYTAANMRGGTGGAGVVVLEYTQGPSLPTVSLVVGNSSASEPNNKSGTGGVSGYMTLARTGVTTASLDVGYSLTTSSATYSTDYAVDAPTGTCTNEGSTGATIPAGLASCTVYFKPVADNLVESSETMDAVLSSGSTYTMDTNREAVMNIADNTTPQCADGTDNDSDGLIDLADPGCVNAADNDETDPVAQSGSYTITSPGFATMSLYDDDIPPPGSISGFSASPLRVRSGQTATLSWTITGMTGCSIDNGVGAVSAADGVHTATTPAVSTRTTFTLTCTNGTTPFVRAVSVGIIPSFIEQ